MKKILISILVILNLTSCNWIDIEPETMVTYTNFYKTEADAEALLVNALLTAQYLYVSITTRDHTKIGAIIDEINDDRTGTDGIRKLSPLEINETYGQGWSQYYRMIHDANYLIDEENRFIKNGQISRERLDFYLQQANYFKALAYFHLARTWGDAPIIPNHTYIEKLGRSPKEAVIAEAIRCAEIAFKLPIYDQIIDCKGKVVASKMWASKGVVAALLADIYSWRGAIMKNNADTEKAIEYCSNIIDGKYGVYACAGSPEAVCEKVLSSRRSSESIWEIDIFQSDSKVDIDNSSIYPGSVEYIGYPINISETNQNKMRYAIYATTINNLYETEDLRKTAYFFEIDKPVNGFEEDKRPAYFNKFRKIVKKETSQNPMGYVNLDCNRVYYRTAGIILLRAECYNRVGNTAGAIADLNKIRGFANAKLYPNGKDDGKNLGYSIFKEWDKEFILERERYYDVVRNGLWNSEMNPDFPTLSDADVKNGALYLPMTKGAIRQGNDLLIETPFWNGRS